MCGSYVWRNDAGMEWDLPDMYCMLGVMIIISLYFSGVG